MFLHKSVNLLVIDDPALFFQFAGNVSIAVTTKLIIQKNGFYLLYNNSIFKDLSIHINTASGWLGAFALIRTPVIKSAGSNSRPLKKF